MNNIPTRLGKLWILRGSRQSVERGRIHTTGWIKISVHSSLECAGDTGWCNQKEVHLRQSTIKLKADCKRRLQKHLSPCFSYIIHTNVVHGTLLHLRTGIKFGCPRCSKQRGKVEFGMTIFELKIINTETNKEKSYIYIWWRSFAIEKLLVD